MSHGLFLNDRFLGHVHNLLWLGTMYPHARFWMEWNPGYLLHSLAFFKCQRGALELNKAWKMFLYHDAEERRIKKELDTATKPEKIVDVPQEPIVKKQTVAQWVDSPVEVGAN